MFYRQKIFDNSLLLLSLVMLLLSSCSKDETTVDVYQGKTYGLTIDVTKSVAIDDNVISTMRVIVYDNSGKLVSNKLTSIAQGAAAKVSATVASGLNNFYVVCNETVELGKLLAAPLNQGELESLRYPNENVVTLIPMYGEVKGALVESDENGANASVTVNGVKSTTLDVDVKRMLARLSLTLIKNVDVTTTADDFTIESVKINVCHLPKNSTFREGETHEDESWIDDVVVVGSGKLSNNGDYDITNGIYSIPDGVDNIKFKDIYIPEHILVDPTDKDEGSYILVEATFRMKNSQLLVPTRYVIQIGQQPPVYHNITRNNHYDIYATIRSLGEVSVLYLESEWTQEQVSGSVEVPFMNVSELSPQFNLTKDINGVISPAGDVAYSYYFWSNVPEDEISIEWGEHLVGESLVEAPVLTILTSQTTPEGASRVTGRVDVKVKTIGLLRTSLSRTHSELMSVRSKLVN